ncbi:MAG: glycosyltransferase family 4 protein [Flavobacteriaceae bacterium]|nr:glycosyltransferase family 4 protein [Flavobacteriaceae bacterium]
MEKKKKLIRITTVPLSLKKLLEGQLGFINGFYKVTAMCSDLNSLKEVGKQEDVAIYELPLKRTINPFLDLYAILKLYSFLRKEQPFIVHTHTPKAGLVGMLAAWLARVPHRLHTVAGLPLLETNDLKRFILDAVEKLTYACATHIYPNSYGLYNIILENKYTTAKKLNVIANGSSNGINTAYFSPKTVTEVQKKILRFELDINEHDFVFIFVGRLVGDKGINELVAAFQMLQNQQQATGNREKTTDFSLSSRAESMDTSLFSLSSRAESRDTSHNIKLLLVGPLESDLYPLLPNTLANIASDYNILSVGYQNDIRPYLVISNALVFPSYREGFPNVVMQAGAMGLPSIVTNINGCNEIIIEGVNGTIIPVKNTQALVEAMQKMVSDTTYHNHLQQNARAMIMERFEQQQVWEALLAEYHRLEKTILKR